jgi:hypothetical protein
LKWVGQEISYRRIAYHGLMNIIDALMNPKQTIGGLLDQVKTRRTIVEKRS